jgi:hypothetical protein
VSLKKILLSSTKTAKRFRYQLHCPVESSDSAVVSAKLTYLKYAHSDQLSTFPFQMLSIFQRCFCCEHLKKEWPKAGRKRQKIYAICNMLCILKTPVLIRSSVIFVAVFSLLKEAICRAGKSAPSTQISTKHSITGVLYFRGTGSRLHFTQPGFRKLYCGAAIPQPFMQRILRPLFSCV